MSARIRFCLVALAFAFAVAACGDAGRLSNELSERYGPALVGVPDSVSGRVVVSFLASPFAERPDSARRVTARKVAEYVRDHYPRYKTVQKVTVDFLTRKETESGKHAAATYTFTRAELDDPPP